MKTKAHWLLLSVLPVAAQAHPGHVEADGSHMGLALIALAVAAGAFGVAALRRVAKPADTAAKRSIAADAAQHNG